VENRSNGPVYADLKKSVDTELAAQRFTPPLRYVSVPLPQPGSIARLIETPFHTSR
jgi:hypothetical protein